MDHPGLYGGERSGLIPHARGDCASQGIFPRGDSPPFPPTRGDSNPTRLFQPPLGPRDASRRSRPGKFLIAIFRHSMSAPSGSPRLDWGLSEAMGSLFSRSWYSHRNPWNNEVNTMRTYASHGTGKGRSFARATSLLELMSVLVFVALAPGCGDSAVQNSDASPSGDAGTDAWVVCPSPKFLTV